MPRKLILFSGFWHWLVSNIFCLIFGGKMKNELEKQMKDLILYSDGLPHELDCLFVEING
jgi:hypothetical protein